MRDKIIEILMCDNDWPWTPATADKILDLLAPTIEKAKKWDRLMSITEPLAITPLLEDWHDTWSTTCPCLPLVIGNVIVHIGGGCSFGGKEDGNANI